MGKNSKQCTSGILFYQKGFVFLHAWKKLKHSHQLNETIIFHVASQVISSTLCIINPNVLMILMPSPSIHALFLSPSFSPNQPGTNWLFGQVFELSKKKGGASFQCNNAILCKVQTLHAAIALVFNRILEMCFCDKTRSRFFSLKYTSCRGCTLQFDDIITFWMNRSIFLIKQKKNPGIFQNVCYNRNLYTLCVCAMLDFHDKKQFPGSPLPLSHSSN